MRVLAIVDSRPAAREIEVIARAQDVKAHVVHGQCACNFRLRDIGVSDAAGVDDINRAASANVKLAFFDDDGGVLVYSDPQDACVLGNGAEQPPKPAPLGEMLVNDDVADQPE